MIPTRNGNIVRIWRGRVRSNDADSYASYLFEGGPKVMLEKLGARGVQILRRDSGPETEFTVLSYWDSIDDMKEWAGENLAKTRHLERDKEMLIELPEFVEIHEVAINIWQLAGTVSGPKIARARDNAPEVAK